MTPNGVTEGTLEALHVQVAGEPKRSAMDLSRARAVPSMEQ